MYQICMQICVSQLALKLEQTVACERVLMHSVDVTEQKIAYFHRRMRKTKNILLFIFRFEWLAFEFHVNMSCTVCG